jgi:hypothetical protein
MMNFLPVQNLFFAVERGMDHMEHLLKRRFGKPIFGSGSMTTMRDKTLSFTTRSSLKISKWATLIIPTLWLRFQASLSETFLKLPA